MAATAVYLNISRCGASANDVPGHDAFSMSNASASSANFTLKGGKYAVDLIASTYGTVGLQRLGPDGSTFIAVATAWGANQIGTTFDLPMGTYKVVVA